MKNRSLIFMLIFPVLMFAGNFSKESLVTTDTQQNNILDNFIEAKLENDRLYLGIPKILPKKTTKKSIGYKHMKKHTTVIFF